MPRRVGGIRRLSPKLDAIVAPDAAIEPITEGLVWAEGPIWAPRGGYLLFSDVPQNVIYRWTAREGRRDFLRPSGLAGADKTIFREPGANGLAIDARGDLVMCDQGHRSLARLDLARRTRTTLVAGYQGRPFNSPNDLILAKNGAIYFSDPPYGLVGLDASPAKALPFNGVYRLAPDASVAVVDRTLSFPNGVGLSPDERTLYVSVSDPDHPRIMAYLLDKHDLPNGGPRVLLDAKPLMKDGAPGLPDGLSVDFAGRLFVAGPGGLLVLTPEGELLGVIETGRTVSNCCFGEDGRTLFITSTDIVVRVRLKVAGPF
jgi:gluconolactonase